MTGFAGRQIVMALVQVFQIFTQGFLKFIKVILRSSCFCR